MSIYWSQQPPIFLMALQGSRPMLNNLLLDKSFKCHCSDPPGEPIPSRQEEGKQTSRSLQRAQGEVCNMINKKYNEFLPSMQSAEDLVSQVDSLSGNIDLLKSRIENEVRQDLNVAIAEFTELKQQLERDSLVLSVLKQLQESH
ncbi:centromere/kinetochore protein zw10 homolog [Gopherus flavomarginatus]|uniref:centromere/kinetochore protein zw10 homolog n=1 Tax=Gopherus flavomarginatus TaxID=286002 RepID=UPI0021CC17A5|nr:centromere/kinetochore protein zw10 homolog [Gopherus flavomarginatus]